MDFRVLDGIRVTDLSQFLSGPRTTQVLAEMGAEVIKIEPPIGETLRLLMRLLPGADRILNTLHTGKKGITLNINRDEGREILLKLVGTSDVLVENFSTGLMSRLKLDYDNLKSVNPRLIYLSITGFGHTGPYHNRTAFDLIAQATGGIMFANRQPDRPPGVFFGDLVSGAFGAIGILSALMQREKTGEGQIIDLSMQDVMYFHNYRAFSKRALGSSFDEVQSNLGRTPEDMIMGVEKKMPFWNSYKTLDGHVALVALTDRQWNRLLEVVNREDLKNDPRFSNFVERIKSAEEGVDIFEEWTKTRKTSEVVDKLVQARIPCGAVLDLDGVNQDPQLKARGMLSEIEDPEHGIVEIPGFPIHLSGGEPPTRTAAPKLGEHNEEVYTELLGIPPEEIKALKKKGII